MEEVHPEGDLYKTKVDVRTVDNKADRKSKSIWDRTKGLLTCSSCRGNKIDSEPNDAFILSSVVEPLSSGDKSTESGKSAVAAATECGGVGDLGLISEENLEEMALDVMDFTKEFNDTMECRYALWMADKDNGVIVDRYFDPFTLEKLVPIKEGENEQGFTLVELSLPTAKVELHVQEVEEVEREDGGVNQDYVEEVECIAKEEVAIKCVLMQEPQETLIKTGDPNTNKDENIGYFSTQNALDGETEETMEEEQINNVPLESATEDTTSDLLELEDAKQDGGRGDSGENEDAISDFSQEDHFAEEDEDLTNNFPEREDHDRADDQVSYSDFYYAQEDGALNGMDIPQRYFLGTGEASIVLADYDTDSDEPEGDMVAANANDEWLVKNRLYEARFERKLIAQRGLMINEVLARELSAAETMGLPEASANYLPTAANLLEIQAEEYDNEVPAENLELVYTMLPTREAFEEEGEEGEEEDDALEILADSAEDDADALASDFLISEDLKKVAGETLEIPFESLAEKFNTKVTTESLEVTTTLPPRENLEESEVVLPETLTDTRYEGPAATFATDFLSQEDLVEAAEVAEFVLLEASVQAALDKVANAAPAPWASAALRPSQEFVQEVADEFIDPMLVQVVRALEQERPLAPTPSTAALGSTTRMPSLGLNLTESSMDLPGLGASTFAVDLGTVASRLDLDTTVTSRNQRPNVCSMNLTTAMSSIDLDTTVSSMGFDTTVSSMGFDSTASSMDLDTTMTSMDLSPRVSLKKINMMMSPMNLTTTTSSPGLDTTVSSITLSPKVSSMNVSMTVSSMDLNTTPSSMDLNSTLSSMDLSPSTTSSDVPCLAAPASAVDPGTMEPNPGRGTASLVDVGAAAAGLTTSDWDLRTLSLDGLAAPARLHGSDSDTACTASSSPTADSEMAPSASRSYEWPDQGKEQHRTARNNNKRNKKRNRRGGRK